MESKQTHDLVAKWYTAMGKADWGFVMDVLDDNVEFILSPTPT